MLRLNRENVLSYFLGAVVIWFGAQELMAPAEWASFVPDFVVKFINNESLVNYLVMGHGAVLALAGLALIFNGKRRVAAAVIALFILAIIGSLFQSSGVTATLVRDVGLFGMALALIFKS